MTVFIEKAVSVTDSEQVPQRHARELRRADAFIRSGVLAVDAIISGSNPDILLPRSQCGLFLGSAFGPMETNFDVLDQVINREQTSPTLFSHSVFNAAAGYLARIFQLHGPAFTFTDFGFPFFQALQQAVVALEYGLVSTCYVLQIETYSPLLHDAVTAHGPDQKQSWQGGACAWLLTATPGNRRSPAIVELTLRRSCSTPQSLLECHGLLQSSDNSTVEISSPLDAVVALSKRVDNSIGTPLSFTLTTPQGEMFLQISATESEPNRV